MPSIMRYIGVINRCAALFRGEKLAGYGIAPNQHTYVLNICRNPGITQEQLCRKIYINKSNVARTLSRLERDGFCERRPSEADKRSLCIYPTQKMLDVCPVVHDTLRQWNEFITGDFPPEDVERFREMLAVIASRSISYADEYAEHDLADDN